MDLTTCDKEGCPRKATARQIDFHLAGAKEVAYKGHLCDVCFDEIVAKLTAELQIRPTISVLKK